MACKDIEVGSLVDTWVPYERVALVLANHTSVQLLCLRRHFRKLSILTTPEVFT